VRGKEDLILRHKTKARDLFIFNVRKLYKNYHAQRATA
jgi:hypothetical protein